MCMKPQLGIEFTLYRLSESPMLLSSKKVYALLFPHYPRAQASDVSVPANRGACSSPMGNSFSSEHRVQNRVRTGRKHKRHHPVLSTVCRLLGSHTDPAQEQDQGEHHGTSHLLCGETVFTSMTHGNNALQTWRDSKRLPCAGWTHWEQIHLSWKEAARRQEHDVRCPNQRKCW